MVGQLEELPPAEVMVVTPYYAFESICNDLKEKIDCPIISLEVLLSFSKFSAGFSRTILPLNQ